jgi:plasmid stabilization system protein ParE
MPFRVVFRPRARADVAAATAWLAGKGPAAVARWRAGLLGVVRKLEDNPTLYPAADEAADLGVDLRELLYGRRTSAYRVLFTITGQTVNILRVRHAAQDRLRPGDV